MPTVTRIHSYHFLFSSSDGERAASTEPEVPQAWISPSCNHFAVKQP